MKRTRQPIRRRDLPLPAIPAVRSKASNAEVITQRIYTCKQQLAADVLPLPSAPAVQQQLSSSPTQPVLTLQLDYYMRQLAAVKPTSRRRRKATWHRRTFNCHTARAAMTTPPPPPDRARTRCGTRNPCRHCPQLQGQPVRLARRQSGTESKKLRVGQTINLPSP